MKVLHLISGLADGGAEAILFRLCQADTRNVHVVVALGGRGKYSGLLEHAGIQVEHLGMSAKKVSFSSFLSLYRVVCSHSPDVIQTWMYHADFLGALIGWLARRTPVCWGVHNSKLVPGHSKRMTILISRVNAVLSLMLPARIIYCAQKAREVHEESGYSRRRSRVIYNGYDLNQFRPEAAFRSKARSQLGLHPDDFVIGMVARFDPMKDHKNFCSAVQKAIVAGVDAKVVMVGAGINAENPALIDILDKCNLADKVILLGARSDINVLMCAFDICVLSSIKEAFPNVLAEAMASGTPCISTNVGDAAEIIGNAGWVVEAANSIELSKAIITSRAELSDSHLWFRKQQSARARIKQHFSLGTMVDSYNAVWREAVNGALNK